MKGSQLDQSITNKRHLCNLFKRCICFILCVCLPSCMYVCVSHVHSASGGRKRVQILEFLNGCKSPYGCWELNLGPAEEQPELLMTEPPLQPPHSIFLKNKGNLWGYIDLFLPLSPDSPIMSQTWSFKWKLLSGSVSGSPAPNRSWWLLQVVKATLDLNSGSWRLGNPFPLP